MEYEASVDDYMEDDGEIFWNGCMFFDTKNILKIKDALQEILNIAQENDFEFSPNIQAVPDGENDYDFACVRFFAEDGEIKIEYLRA